MEYNKRNCMSIQSIVDDCAEIPLSPPESYKSQSTSPNMDYISSPTIATIEPRRSICHLPMTVEERRYRNKLASAKYRAKKQANIKSMSSKVSQLMANNMHLQKELSKVKQENEVLRAILSSYQQKDSLSCPSSYHQHYQQNYLSQSAPFY